jgi:PKHD-type hydroxylase
MYQEIDNYMSPTECKDLIAFCENNLPFQKSHYVTDHRIIDGKFDADLDFDEKKLKADAFFLPEDHPINEKVWATASDWAEQNNYNFDSSTGTLIHRYRDGGHYGWHVDGFGKTDRFSMSIQLSDPNDYEGCELQFGEDLTGSNRTTGQDAFHDWELTQKSVKPIHTFSKNIGAGCIYDSFIYHRVTPLVKGTRYVLLHWFREYNDNTKNT